MINKIKKQAMSLIKQKPKIILYTIIYILIISLFESFHYILEWRLDIYGSMRLSLLKLIVNILFKSIEITFFTSYVYMIIKNKLKFKRFIIFLNKKHINFFVLTIILLIIPLEISNMLFNVYKNNNKVIAIISSIILIFINLFLLCIVIFKAVYVKEKFTLLFKKSFDFLRTKILIIIIFNLSFVLWEVIILILIYIFYLKLDCNDFIYILLNKSYYGLGIIVLPYYVLSFTDLIIKSNNKTV